MRSTVWFVCLVACLSLRLATSSPVASSLDSAASLDPALLEPVEENEDRGERDLGLKAAAGFGIKNFLLDFVFGKVNQVIDYKTRLVTQLDRTNRYKNYYLLNLGTKPRGVATSGAAASAQVSVGAARGAATDGGYPAAGGPGLGALTSLFAGLNGGAGGK